MVEYPQGWVLRPIDAEGQKQAAWRTDPDRAGASACVADIGTDAESLARYITTLRIDELCADFTTFVEGRRLEDDANLLLRYKGGARGVLCASQILAGEENDFNIWVYGTKASLEWHQENPDYLIVKYPDTPRQVLRRGSAYASDAARRATRLQPGGPKPLRIFTGKRRGQSAPRLINGELIPEDLDFPTTDGGVEGMAFIATAVKSAKAGGIWTKMPASNRPAHSAARASKIRSCSRAASKSCCSFIAHAKSFAKHAASCRFRDDHSSAI